MLCCWSASSCLKYNIVNIAMKKLYMNQLSKASIKLSKENLTFPFVTICHLNIILRYILYMQELQEY